MQTSRTIRQLCGFLWPAPEEHMRWRVVGSMSLLALSRTFSVLLPLFYKEIIDSLHGTSFAIPMALILAYAGARIGSQALSEIKDWLFSRVEHQAIRKLSLRIFKHMHALSLRFHMDRKTGGLSRAIELGVKAMETFLRLTFFNIMPTFLEIFFAVGILAFYFGASFALVTAATLFIYVVWTIRVTEWRTQYIRKMNMVDGDASGKAVDSLLNYETVKYFTNESHEASRYDIFLASYEQAALKSKAGLAVLGVGQGLIISIGVTLLMIMGVMGMQAGHMTLGDFVMSNSYVLQLYAPLFMLGFSYREIKFSLVNMEKMFVLLEETQEIVDAPDAQVLQVSQGAITFDHVSFAYNADRAIIQDLNFTIEGGKTVAFVGTTGAGKSTISRLLFRFYDPQQGQIRIDGQDIAQVTQHSLRHAIGIVPQDTVLFNDTLGYNVGYGRPGASDEEIWQAIRAAHLEAFVQSLPQGLETMVGERGLKLSGGEKQRVAIARTLLKNPAIFIFDEATSSLDTHTEKAIHQNLQEISTGHTTLIIAHRLSTVVNADWIYVLDKGHIIEEGTHPSLLLAQGAYAQLWHRQQDKKKGPAED